MLSQEQVRTIEVLLDTSKLSQREIARRVKVDRETVGRIAKGDRADYVFLRRQRAKREPRRLITPIRCRNCGAKIRVFPCRLCHVHWLVQTGQAKRMLDGRTLPQPLGVELTGDVQQRYLAILAAKIRRGEQPVNSRMTVELQKGDSSMPLNEGVYVQWFLNNSGALVPLLELPDQLSRTTSLCERWELLKKPAEKILGLAEKVPVEAITETQSLDELEEEAESLGIPWMQLMELVPTIIQLIELARGMNRGLFGFRFAGLGATTLDVYSSEPSEQ